MICKNLTNNPIFPEILEYVKNFLRVSGDSDDSNLEMLILSVVQGFCQNTGYSIVANDFECSFNINLMSTSLLENDCCYWLKLPVKRPFNNLIEVKNHDDVLNIESDVHDFYIKLNVDELFCKCELFLTLTYNAGHQTFEEIPKDILLAIAIKTQILYDGCCDACYINTYSNTVKNYNKTRFL